MWRASTGSPASRTTRWPRVFSPASTGRARLASRRGPHGRGRYLDDRGRRVLDCLDRVAGERSVPVAAVALAWLIAQPTVVSAIASARDTNQLRTLLTGAGLQLSGDELALISEASAS